MVALSRERLEYSVLGGPALRRITSFTLRYPPSPMHQPPFSHPPFQRLVGAGFFAAPLAPCLLTCVFLMFFTAPVPPVVAVLAFSAFFLLSASVRFALPSVMAAWRAAARASGLCDRLSLITSRVAPTMPRCCLTVRRVRFLATSCRGV